MDSSQFLTRPEGRVAYDVTGSGPLVVCSPGMGELRSSYRHLVPLLVDRGFRVATLDLRGHGDSDATFSAYDDVALASDLLALADGFGGPALLVGNSMGAGAAVIAAADRPDLVRGLVLLGPFVRNPPGGRLATLAFRLALLKPWGPAAFMSYYPRWTPGARPEGYDEHTAAVRREPAPPRPLEGVRADDAHDARPGRGATRRGGRTGRRGDGRRRRGLDGPGRGGRLVAERLGADVLMVPGVGHYPQAQAPTWSRTPSVAGRGDQGA